MNKRPTIDQLLKGLKGYPEVIPSADWRENARIRILNLVTPAVKPHWYQKPRIWGYTVGSALATATLSVGVAFAAQSSLPNSPLYPVKLLSEHVALTLSPTESLKTSVAQSIISRRISEVEEVQKTGNKKRIDESIVRLHEDVDAIKNREDISRDRINETLTQHENLIKSLPKEEQEKETDQTLLTPTPTAIPTISEEPEKTPTPAPTGTQGEMQLPRVEGTSTEDHHDD